MGLVPWKFNISANKIYLCRLSQILRFEMVSWQFHYTKTERIYAFLFAEILNFQGSTHLFGVGSFDKLNYGLITGAAVLQNGSSYCTRRMYDPDGQAIYNKSHASYIAAFLSPSVNLSKSLNTSYPRFFESSAYHWKNKIGDECSKAHIRKEMVCHVYPVITIYQNENYGNHKTHYHYI